MEEKRIGGLPLRVSPLLEPVPHCFTTRQGGVSRGIFSSLDLSLGLGDDPDLVRENYRRVCLALGADPAGLVLTRQVHRDGVRRVTREDWGKGLDRDRDYEADGLITDVPGTTLAAFGADCLTLLLYDPVHRAAGAVHAGWRGTALGIAARAVEAMAQSYGTDPARLRAALGPCIGPCCFETGPEVPEAMETALGLSARPYSRPLGNGKYKVDLRGLNRLWLERAGVEAGGVDASEECTMCLPRLYWSHRYTQGKRGIQAALITLPEVGR